jgi:hypothetical protein
MIFFAGMPGKGRVYGDATKRLVQISPRLSKDKSATPPKMFERKRIHILQMTLLQMTLL